MEAKRSDVDKTATCARGKLALRRHALIRLPNLSLCGGLSTLPSPWHSCRKFRWSLDKRHGTFYSPYLERTFPKFVLDQQHSTIFSHGYRCKKCAVEYIHHVDFFQEISLNGRISSRAPTLSRNCVPLNWEI